MNVHQELNDDAVLRLLSDRNLALDLDTDSQPARPSVIGLVHHESATTAILFLRFVGHANPADNGYAAYVVEAENGLDAVREASKIYLQIKDGFI